MCCLRLRVSILRGMVGLATLALTLAACAAPQQTIKIALVAPFEGRFREVGYAAFPAFRLALRQQMEAGGIGNYQVSFVAYNDNANTSDARLAAASLVLDEQVIAVIGHLRADTTNAALSTYTDARLPMVVPDVPSDLIPADVYVTRLGPTTTALRAALQRCPSASGDASISEGMAFKGDVSSEDQALLPDMWSSAAANLLGSRYRGICFASFAPVPRDLPAATQQLRQFAQVSGGAEPSPRSISAYDATRLVLQAIQTDITQNGKPSREGVARALRQSNMTGLLGTVKLNAEGVWTDAPMWVYAVNPDGTLRIVK